jgi:indole-3-glycerol phosphate synthase
VRPGLAEIVARKRKDLEHQMSAVPLAELERRLANALPVRDFAGALRKPGEVSLIAEMKKASPSAGLLRELYHVPTGAEAYAKAGARALSVLTEVHYFLGDVTHIGEAKKACPLPVLRKDFVVDAYQIHEARVAGADAVLLIVAILTPPLLKSLIAAVRRLGMCPLVEAHWRPTPWRRPSWPWTPERKRSALTAGTCGTCPWTPRLSRRSSPRSRRTG